MHKFGNHSNRCRFGCICWQPHASSFSSPRMWSLNPAPLSRRLELNTLDNYAEGVSYMNFQSSFSPSMVKIQLETLVDIATNLSHPSFFAIFRLFFALFRTAFSLFFYFPCRYHLSSLNYGTKSRAYIPMVVMKLTVSNVQWSKCCATSDNSLPHAIVK